MFPRVWFLLVSACCAFGQSVQFQWVQQIGGSQGQTIANVAADSAGNLYVAGTTGSANFPVKNAIQSKPGGAGLYRIDGTAQWQNLYGSGLAAVSALVPDPTSPQTLYALAGNGISRSIDAGGSWSSVATFDVSVAGLAVDPSAGNILYLGTAGEGVLKSTDRGVTWTPINNGLSPSSQDGKLYGYGVWVDPNRPAVVLANTGQGLARSTDGGATWQLVPQVSQLSNIGGVAFDSTAPGTVYAAGFNSISKSTDDGATWTALPVPPNSQFYTTTVLPDPLHSGVIYASGFSGLWKSTDGGNTWTQKLGTQVFELTGDGAGTIYYATFNQVFSSQDGLASTTPLGPTLPYISTIALLGTHVFVGTQGDTDVFVAKLDPQGNPLWATYFGGASTDQAQAMTVDSSGGVYVTGTTASSDFPVSQGAYAKSGASFLFKLNGDGSLAYSTYFASGGNTPNTIAVDSAGSAYIAGNSGGNLPVTAGAYETTLQGSIPCCTIGPGLLLPLTNGFLTKFSASGTSLVFSTYIGSQYASVTALALAPNGEAVMSGISQLYRLSADGSTLRSTAAFPGYLSALLFDPAGNLFVGGSTGPAYALAFKPTPGAFETVPPFPSPAGSGYGFVARLDSQFNITAATLLAGEGGDNTLCLAPAPNGNIYAGGSTGSKAFPSRGAAQGSFAQQTGFVAELTGDLTGAVFSTFAGDTRSFNVRTMAPTPDGGMVFAGFTNGVGYYPYFGSNGALTPSGTQAFLVKAMTQPAMPRIDSVLNAASHLGVALSPGETFIVNGAGFGDDAVLLLNGVATPLPAHNQTSLTAALPLEFTAAGAVTVTVQSGGSTSNAFLAPFLATSPGIFSVDGTGAGQAYVVNADGTVNSLSNPTKPGAAITIYATGVGHMTFTQGYAVTDASPIVGIDGFGAPGIGASFGPVTGLPGNVYQISVYVPNPAAYASGNPNLTNFVFPPMSPIFLEFNGVVSQNQVWIAVGQ